VPSLLAEDITDAADGRSVFLQGVGWRIIELHCDLPLLTATSDRVMFEELVEALCYKPEGHTFDSRWVTGFFY
jgi:hypothetical protein